MMPSVMQSRMDVMISSKGLARTLSSGRHYQCNDGHADDNFEDLVFRVLLMSESS
jgi:hypothetical protein